MADVKAANKVEQSTHVDPTAGFWNKFRFGWMVSG